MRLTLVVATLAAAAALIATSCGGNGDQDSSRDSPSALGSPTPLSMDDWAEQVCALAAAVDDNLDVPDKEMQGTLTERRQWVAEIVAPRAEELALIEEDIATLHPPNEVVEFAGTFTNYHDDFRLTVNSIVGAWQELVDTAEEAQSTGEINAASIAFARAKREAIEGMTPLDQAWLVSDNMRKALSEPQDCGFLH